MKYKAGDKVEVSYSFGDCGVGEVVGFDGDQVVITDKTGTHAIGRNRIKLFLSREAQAEEFDIDLDWLQKIFSV